MHVKGVGIIALAVLLSAFFVTTDVAAQNLCGLLSASASGDEVFTPNSGPTTSDYVTQSAIRAPLFAAWDACVASVAPAFSAYSPDCFGRTDTFASCANSFTNLDCGNRRLLNAMLLMKALPYFGGPSTWFDYVASNAGSVSLDADMTCSNSGHTNPFEAITLNMRAMFNSSLLVRASIIAHEARHADGGANAFHCGWPDFNNPSYCSCSESVVSCDERWSGNGTNRRAVEFLEQAIANQHLFTTSAFAIFDAWNRANAILDGRFHFHPGFNLAEAPGLAFQRPSRRSWTYSSSLADVEASVFGDEDVDGAMTVLQSVSMLSEYFTVANLRACVQFRKYNASRSLIGNVWYPDISGAGTVLSSLSPLDGGPACVSRVFTSSGPGATITPPTLSSPTPVGLTAIRTKSDGNGNITQMEAEYRMIDRGAAFGPQLLRQSNPGAPGGNPWDTDVIAPEGMFITGLGFGASSGRLNAVAANFGLGPELERRAGGNGGNSFGILGCPAGWVPVGIDVKSAPSPYGTNTLGYFAMICATSEWLHFVDNPLKAYVRTSYMETTTGTFYPAETTFVATNRPPNTTTRYCALGDVMRGMVLNAGVEIDKMVSILCTANTVYDGERSVNVGGAGGTGQFVQDCWTSPGPERATTNNNSNRWYIAPFFYYRSGWRLDSIAMGCYSALDDTESFELSGATGQVPTVPNALPDVRASWVDASANTLVGQGFGNGTPSLSQPYSAWQRSTGPTPTNGTGPSGAGEGNFYLLAGASTPGAQTGSVFVLERAAVDLRNVPSDGVASLTFMYHMFGANMGSLRVSVRRKVTPLPNWTEVWSASSGATNAWQTATISLNGYLGSNVDIRIAASRGNGPASDIALDAVRIRTGW